MIHRKHVFFILTLTLVFLSSCRKDCDGTGPSLNVTNRCDFNVDLEVEIIGDSTYIMVLVPGENSVFYPHETRVKIKVGKEWSITSLSRTKKFEAQNCKHYVLDLMQNDSSNVYRLDLDFSQKWD